MSVPTIPRWDNITAPDLSNSLRMFREGMSGIGGLINNQLDRNQKVVDEQDATNLYNFKNALSGAMTSPEAIQDGISSGQYAAMANAMGVRPEQARGFLDMDKLVPEARTRETQELARNEANQLREVLPMLQQMENTIRSGTSASELEPGFQELVNTGTLSADMVNKLRKASFVANDQRLAQGDAATNRQITKENQADAERRRAEARRVEDEATKLREETERVRAALQPLMNSLPADANQGDFISFARQALKDTVPGTSAKAVDTVMAEVTEQFKNSLLTLGPAEEQRKAAITKQNAEAIATYQNLVKVAEKSREYELAEKDLPGGLADSLAGTELIENAMAAIGLPASTKDGDGKGDQSRNVRGVISNYYDKLPAATIAKAIKQASPDRPWFGKRNWVDADTDRSRNIQDILDAELKNPKTEANMRKIDEINKRVLDAQRNLTNAEMTLYGALPVKKQR